MDKFQETNLALWNELTSIHERSEFYDVPSFLAGRQTLLEIELKELPEVEAKSLLHLQCHFGMDTLSWARLGAKVTGVDFSDKAIELARRFALELGLDARFVHSNIFDLPATLDDKFDLVFTSYGVLYWLNDLTEWAKIIHHFLKPGGTFLIVEEHPMTYFLDEKSDPSCLKFGNSYFNSGVRVTDDDYSYADDTKLKNTVSYEWGHTLDEIFSAILGAGLQIESFHEYPFLVYQKFKWLVKGTDGWWHMPDGGNRDFPFQFSLKARRPLR